MFGKINSPLNDLLNDVEWGEFRIGDLFDIGTGSLLSSHELKNGQVPRISAKSETNGILGYFDTEHLSQARHFERFITVNFFGADGGIFFHPYKASVEMKVHVLTIPGIDLNVRTGNFIAAALKKTLKGFGYGVQLSSSKLKKLDLKIKLPVTKGKINFDFMENFISALEAENLSELEAYLSVSGFKDYNLTSQEQKAIDEFNDLKFESFKVTDIFDIKNSGNILSRDVVENSGKTPYLCASAENNGVSSYISYDEKYLDKGNCVFIGGKTFVVSYQEKDFFSNDSHNLILYLKDKENRIKLTQLYLATCIKKSLAHQYSWGDSISNKKIQKDKVALPTKNYQPDFSSMATLISAIQKLVIKDVVLYADEKNKAMGLELSSLG